MQVRPCSVSCCLCDWRVGDQASPCHKTLSSSFCLTSRNLTFWVKCHISRNDADRLRERLTPAISLRGLPESSVLWAVDTEMWRKDGSLITKQNNANLHLCTAVNSGKCGLCHKLDECSEGLFRHLNAPFLKMVAERGGDARWVPRGHSWLSSWASPEIRSDSCLMHRSAFQAGVFGNGLPR